MSLLKAIIIALSCALAAPIIFEQPAEARSSLKNKKRVKKKRRFKMRKNHKRGRVAGHHHHHHKTGFSLGLGMTTVFTQPQNSSETDENSHESEHEGDHDDHGHALASSKYSGLRLHGGDGHNHGSEGGESSGSDSDSSTGPSLMLSINPGYQLNHRWGVVSQLSYDVNTGILDPTLALTHEIHKKKFDWSSQVGVSAPLSEASRTNQLTTTISVASGPTFRKGRWSFGVQASYAHNVYSAPLQPREESGESGELALTQTIDEHDEDHEGESHDEGHDETHEEGHSDSEHHDEDGDHGQDHDEDQHSHDSHSADAVATRTSATTDEHIHDHEDHAAEPADDRQISRLGTTANIDYNFNSKFSYGAAYGVHQNNSELGETSIESEATLGRITYKFGNMSASGWFSLTETGSSLGVPSNPLLGASLNHQL